MLFLNLTDTCAALSSCCRLGFQVLVPNLRLKQPLREEPWKDIHFISQTAPILLFKNSHSRKEGQDIAPRSSSGWKKTAAYMRPSVMATAATSNLTTLQ